MLVTCGHLWSLLTLVKGLQTLDPSAFTEWQPYPPQTQGVADEPSTTQGSTTLLWRSWVFLSKDFGNYLVKHTKKVAPPRVTPPEQGCGAQGCTLADLPSGNPNLADLPSGNPTPE